MVCRLQWGLGFSTEERRLIDWPSRLPEIGLQWGLGFSTEESLLRKLKSASRFRRLQWGLGFSTEERYLRNCATTKALVASMVFQPRKADTDTDTDADDFQASMGPRFFNRGKPGTLGGVREIGGTLQWGLGFSTEERTG